MLRNLVGAPPYAHTVLPRRMMTQPGAWWIVLDKGVSAAVNSWHPINSRLLTVRLRHSLGGLIIIVAYAPTNDSDDNVNDDFYNSLQQTIQCANPADVILCVGDFNAVTGTERDGFRSVIGPCSGIPNDNTERLLNFCAVSNLRVAGSWFDRRDIQRNTWYSSDGHTSKEIDHILVNTRWKAVQNCRVCRVWNLTVATADQ